MLKFLNFILCLLIYISVSGYGFEMDLKNSSSFSYTMNTSKLRNVEIFDNGRKISKVEIKPGERRRITISFLTEGKNAEYGDIIFSKTGLFGCRLAAISFVAPEFSDYVIPSLNRVCSLCEFINRKKGFVAKKTFDHREKRYLFEIGRIDEGRPAADSDMVPLLPSRPS